MNRFIHPLELAPGQSGVFYRGALSRDSSTRVTIDKRPVTDDDIMRGVHAWRMYESGKGTIVHRRLGEFDYEYIFQRNRS